MSEFLRGIEMDSCSMRLGTIIHAFSRQIPIPCCKIKTLDFRAECCAQYMKK